MVEYLLRFGLAVLMFGQFRELAASEFIRADDLFGATNSFIRQMSADGSTFTAYESGTGPPYFVWRAGAGRAFLESHEYSSTQPIDVSSDGSRVWTLSQCANQPCLVEWSADGSTAVLLESYVALATPDGQTFIGYNRMDGSLVRFSATNDGYVEETIRRSIPDHNLHGVSSDGTTVVGFRSGSGSFRWNEETGYMDSLGFLPGYPYSEVGGYGSQGDVVSADGSVVVGEAYGGPNGFNQAFRWTVDEGMVGLGFLEGHKDSAAYTVSSDGLVVLGRSREAEYGTFRVACVWDEANGMRSLQQVLKDEFGLGSELDDVNLVSAMGISEDRQVMYGRFPIKGGTYGELEMWVAKLDRPLVAFEASDIVGDLTNDRVVDIHDVDVLRSAVRNGSTELPYDLNRSGAVDGDDLTSLVHDTLHSWFGDANLDGQFSTNDLVTVFQAGQYEDTVENNSTWGTGDWNADGNFTTSDLVAAFQDGGYEMGPRAVAPAVPEPSTSLLLGLGVLAGSLRIRRR